MKSIFHQLALILLCISQIACAQEPNAPVGPRQASESSNSDNSELNEDTLELMSLKYEGRDPFGTLCTLYIAASEEEHEGHDHDEEEHHELLAKLDYKVHGEAILDSVVSVKRYNIETNKYSNLAPKDAGSTPVFASALLNDKDTQVDFNKLLNYEQEGELVQSLRIDLDEMDFENFETALETVIEDSSKLADHKAQLDKVQRAVLKVSHNGHYDPAACSGFKLKGTALITFNLSGDHDNGDDHDHDH